MEVRSIYCLIPCHKHISWQQDSRMKARGVSGCQVVQGAGHLSEGGPCKWGLIKRSDEHRTTIGWKTSKHI